jgi:hypothetical protein
MLSLINDYYYRALLQPNCLLILHYVRHSFLKIVPPTNLKFASNDKDNTFLCRQVYVSFAIRTLFIGRRTLLLKLLMINKYVPVISICHLHVTAHPPGAWSLAQVDCLEPSCSVPVGF